MQSIYQETVLKNGLTMVTHRMPSMSSVTVGLWLKAGGRFETKKNNGISHFLEHLVFKGTKRRTYRQLKEAIEGVGGSLNGFTAEEMTCYLAKIVGKHLLLTMDVLSDMILNPLLKEEDVDKERMVIQEEIKMYEDLPSSSVHAIFDELLWPGQPLGFMIGGRKEVIESLSKEEILAYKERYYNPSNLVVAAAGNLEHDKAVKEIERIFGSIPRCRRGRFSPAKDKQSRPEIKLKVKDTQQTHICLGGKALPRNHPDRYAVGLLNVILGGNMSSRLFNEVREKRGLAYDIKSSSIPFHDTGVFLISAGVDNRKVTKTIQVIMNELKKVKSKPVPRNELRRAKDFISGQIALALEDTYNYMQWLGERKLCLGQIIRPEEVLENIEKVTAGDLQRMAKLIFKNKNLNLALIGPVKEEKEIKRLLHF